MSQGQPAKNNFDKLHDFVVSGLNILPVERATALQELETLAQEPEFQARVPELTKEFLYVAATDIRPGEALSGQVRQVEAAQALDTITKGANPVVEQFFESLLTTVEKDGKSVPATNNYALRNYAAARQNAPAKLS